MMHFCSNSDTRGLLYLIFGLSRRDHFHTLGCYRDRASEFDMCRTSAVLRGRDVLRQRCCVATCWNRPRSPFQLRMADCWKVTWLLPGIVVVFRAQVRGKHRGSRLVTLWGYHQHMHRCSLASHIASTPSAV